MRTLEYNMTQYNLAKDLKLYEKTEQTIQKELQQFHEMDKFEPVCANT